MPTESDYLDAQTSIGLVADNVEDIQSATRLDLQVDPGLEGLYGEVIDELLELIANKLADLYQWLCDLKADLGSKANECRGYTADMTEWRSKCEELDALHELEDEGAIFEIPLPSKPPEPDRPFPQAEES